MFGWKKKEPTIKVPVSVISTLLRTHVKNEHLDEKLGYEPMIMMGAVPDGYMSHEDYVWAWLSLYRALWDQYRRPLTKQP